MRVEYQEGSRLFLSIECLDSNYADFRIAMFKLRVKLLYARVFLPRVRRSL
jgi:hypothetical protein